jgi:hypothetical protein
VSHQLDVDIWVVTDDVIVVRLVNGKKNGSELIDLAGYFLDLRPPGSIIGIIPDMK